MTQKWNLQDIRPAEPRKKKIPTEPLTQRPRPQSTDREDAPDVMSVNIVDGKKKKNKALILAIVIFLLVVGGGVIASIITGGAELTVYPKFRQPTVNATFEAKKEAQSDELPYEIMTLDATGERQVKASGQQNVQKQAEGTIFIYNNHSADPIRLVTNTRFESPDGLIYKIKDPAVVPGYSVDTNGKKTPGVVTADVYADQVGENYNLGPTHFTIPGFKGDPEYNDVYGESTSDFTGGFDGMKFIIDNTELQTTTQALRTELRNSLLQKMDSKKPAGMVIFDGAVSFTYDSLPAVKYGDNLATIKEKVTLHIPMFKEDEFASFLAAATVPGYEKKPVRVDDVNNLTFTYTNATTSATNISDLSSLSFKLTGKPTIVWTYDEAKLKADLEGKSRTALNAVLGGYPAIEHADASIRPFWSSKFPMSPDKISIQELLKKRDSQ